MMFLSVPFYVALSFRAPFPSEAEESRLVCVALGTNPAFPIPLQVGRFRSASAISCAPQTARDPSASVGMTDTVGMTE
jgi:hypothetical protein